MTDARTDPDSDPAVDERRLRLRAFLAAHSGEVALALVVAALVGGWLAGTAYVAPGTTTEERVTGSWERTSTFTHAATVTGSPGPFEPGQRLSNRSVYFSRASPVLDVTYRTGYAASDGGALDATVRLRLVRRAVADDGRTLWRTSRVLARQNATDLPPDGRVAVPASVNVSAVADRMDELVAALGASPGETEVVLRADVRLAGRVNGRAVTRSFDHEVGLAVAGETYRVTGQPRSSATHEATTTVATERSYGPPRRVGGPLLLGVGLVGLVGLAVARVRGELELTAAERDWLAYRDDRSTFDEWIHAVELPPEARELPRARATSLADLVDLAIDVDATVLAAPDGRTYHVVHDGYLYAYVAPPVPGRRSRDATTGASDGRPDDGESGEGAPGGVSPDESIDEVTASSGADARAVDAPRDRDQSARRWGREARGRDRPAAGRRVRREDHEAASGADDEDDDEDDGSDDRADPSAALENLDPSFDDGTGFDPGRGSD